MTVRVCKRVSDRTILGALWHLSQFLVLLSVSTKIAYLRSRLTATRTSFRLHRARVDSDYKLCVFTT